MSSRIRLFSLFVLLLVLFAFHGTALANKQVYKAQLRSDNELHEVVGANATGSFVMGTNQDGTFRFVMSVRGLSGAPVGAHIHGPATTAENGPVVVTLCGGPAPSAVGACTFDSSTGSMTIEGTITGAHLQPGVTGGQFISWLRDGLLYINVHTSLNPAGETRGQLLPQ